MCKSSDEFKFDFIPGATLQDWKDIGKFPKSPGWGLNTPENATDPKTGASKGRKPERYSLIPVESLAELARVYDYGSKKYEDHNWRKGYPWSWSYDALERHEKAFWGGQNRDEESGLHHMAHAAFHTMTLIAYDLGELGTDDRP